MPKLPLGNTATYLGDWVITEAIAPSGGAYRGAVHLAPDGEACTVSWDRDGTRCQGPALAFGDLIVASRQPIGEEQIPEDGRVGLVFYHIRNDGTLPARWYHPSLRGKVGTGISTDGPIGQLAGTYKADYKTAADETFEPLQKQLSEDDGVYRLTWLKAESAIYEGVGMRVADHLAVGWGPPGTKIELAVLRRPAGDENKLTGTYVAIDQRGNGQEMISRVT
ncbi:MAG: hypothetical protein ACR2RB_13445 [Gammaproteobacteria bacterium]